MHRTVHQFHPTLTYGDAVSNDCFELRSLLWRWRVRSDLFAQEVKPPLRAFARPHTELPADTVPGELLLVHVSMGNDSLDEVRERPIPKAVVYHNITPATYFAGLNEHARRYAEIGREQLARYAKVSELGIGDSEYNRLELEALGFARTAVVPILVDWAQFEVEPDPAVARRLADERTDVLVVGQILPQKAIHDVVAAFARYRESDPSARLHLVGSTAMSGGYKARLDADVARLGLSDAVDFPGSVSMEELVAYFRGASVLLTLSDHEGFCVPVLEAMRFDLPVVAHAAGAIPETLGDAGILLERKTPDDVAAALERAVRDPSLRADLVARGHARLAAFTPERVGTALRRALGTASISLPAPRALRVVVMSSDERCGIHDYSEAVCDGLRANGHEVSFLGVERGSAADLRRKVGLVRPETDVVLVEHEAGIFPEVPFVRALASLRRRGLPTILSLHELEPGKFHQYRMLTQALHFRQRHAWPLEVARVPWVAARLASRFTKYRAITFLMGALPQRLVVHSKRSAEWIDVLTADPRKVDEMPLLVMPLETERPRDAAAKRALRERLGIPLDRFVFVSPGFFFRRKRFVEVLSVLPPDAYCVLSGTESEWDPGYLAVVRELVDAHGLTNVKIDTDFAAMPDNVAAADAIVLYYDDVFQSAIATQALWAELPAIYSDIPGFRAYEGAGLFARDLEDLRRAMDEIRRPETHARLRRQVRVVKRMLSPERNAPRYLAGLVLRGEDAATRPSSGARRAP